MEHIYAVETGSQLEAYQNFVSQIQVDLEEYITYLQDNFQVGSLPSTIVWTSKRIATTLISDIPIPAYTNDHRIVMCPETDAWRDIYLSQIDGISGDAHSEIRNYYRTVLNRHHILQILGHELAHHSELFVDEVYDSGEGIWFEEGMVEYISRRYFLTAEEFQQETHINRHLVVLYEQHHEAHSLQTFGASTYRCDYAAIFYGYWRSFLAVNQIIDQHNGDIQAVFQSYRQWFDIRSELTLEQWFGIQL